MRYAIALAFTLTACAIPRRSLPPLPGDRLPSAAKLSGLAKLSPPRKASITLEWYCAAVDNPDLYETGLVGTTNLATWYEVARLPYQPTNRCTLTNRPPAEFYRAFNRIKAP